MLFKMKCNRYYFFENLLFNVAILYMWCPHYAKFLDPSLIPAIFNCGKMPTKKNDPREFVQENQRSKHFPQEQGPGYQ
jgi:hypothetical protein